MSGMSPKIRDVFTSDKSLKQTADVDHAVYELSKIGVHKVDDLKYVQEQELIDAFQGDISRISARKIISNRNAPKPAASPMLTVAVRTRGE